MKITPQNDYIQVKTVKDDSDEKLFVIVGGSKVYRVQAVHPGEAPCKKGDLVLLAEEPEMIRINDSEMLFTTDEKVRGVLDA